MPEAPLSGYRALDLCDEKGLFCGRILADLGVDVIQVEKPGGSSTRLQGPFLHDKPDPEMSLYWFCYTANKKGITLNIETKDGQEIFRRLVKGADFVVESFDPGYMASLGLDYASLAQIKPELVMTSITPFGQDGPYKNYKSSDLICWSFGGYTWIVGDADRPPVQVSFPQAYLHGAAEAAIASLTAHYYRLISGEGQYVDVSIQASVARNLTNAPLFYEISNIILKRAGPYRVGLSLAAGQRVHWECKDGYIAFIIIGGPTGAQTNRDLVEYMDSEGVAPQFMKEVNWKEFDMSTASEEFWSGVNEAMGKFFKSHTKEELYAEAVRRNMTLYPMATAKDIVEDPQLKARQFWEEVSDPELGTMSYPGALAKLSETPCVPRERAPHIGEYNREIYAEELGFSEGEMVTLRESGVI